MLPKSGRQSIVVSTTLWTGSTDQSKPDFVDDWLVSHVCSRRWNCAPIREIKRRVTTWRDTSRRKVTSNRRLRSFNKHQPSAMRCDFVGYDWKAYLAWNVSLRLGSSIGRVHGDHCCARHSGWYVGSGTILSNITDAGRSSYHSVSQGIVSSTEQGIAIYWIDLLGWLDFESDWFGFQTWTVLCLSTNRWQVCSIRETFSRRTCQMRSSSVGKNVDVTQVTRMADYFMQLKQFDKAVDLLAAIDRVCSD